MALPQGDDPIPPEEGDAPDKARRPQWLVGPEEGLAAEGGAEERALPKPQLRRLDLPEGGAPSAAPTARPQAPSGPRAATPGVTPVLGASAPAPSASRIPDLDDARGRSSTSMPRLETSPDGAFGGDLAPPPRSGKSADSMPGGGGGFLEFDEFSIDPPMERAPQTRPAPAPTWSPPRSSVAAVGEDDDAPARGPSLGQKAIELLARYWIWGAAALAAALAAQLGARAVGVGTTPIGAILSDPARFDGAEVRVRGKVGQDVFPVGGGFTFYLIRGRDSIVVFTRTRTPLPRQSVEVLGQISTGFIGDESRPALLESVAPPKQP